MLALPFVVQLGIFGWYSMQLDKLERLEKQQFRSREVVGRLNWIQSQVYAAVLGKAGATAQAGAKEYDLMLARAKRVLPESFDRLKVVMAGDTAQVERVQDLQRSTDRLFSALDRSSEPSTHKSAMSTKIATDSASNSAWASAAKSAAQTVIKNAALSPAEATLNDTQIRALLNNITELRSAILSGERETTPAQSSAVAAVQKDMRHWLNVFTLLDFVVMMTLLGYFSKDIAKRLAVVSENALRLVRKQKLVPPVPGEDEIARFDQLFHNVAGLMDEMMRRERAVIENVSDVICEFNSDIRITNASPATLTQWGYEPDDLLGRRLSDITPKAPMQRMMQSLQALAESGGTVEIESQIMTKNRGEIEVVWSVSWSEDEHAFFAVAHDITERKRIDQMKQQLVAMVSHDIRTPLTCIQIYFESLLMGAYGEVTESMQKKSEIAVRSVETLMTMVNSLLDAEKLQSGTLDVSLNDTSLDFVLEDAVNALSNLAQRRNVSITLEKLGVHVRGDVDRLSQVFTNLLGNALKFSPDNAQIKVFSSLHGDVVEVSVQDQGRGVPPEFRDAIFERFKQVSADDAKRGTGLGLAICKTIVELHHGQIGVDSEVGKGSRFWVKLPISRKTQLIGHPADTTDSSTETQAISHPNPAPNLPVSHDETPQSSHAIPDESEPAQTLNLSQSEPEKVQIERTQQIEKQSVV